MNYKVNPGSFFLYDGEGSAKSYTGILAHLKERVHAQVLREAAAEAIKRFPYFSVKFEMIDSYMYLVKNDRLIVV
ncbi:MAG: hypothetical protein HUJ68_03730, partial [Clostridia bacterium]|nr:hypothetical protein [Clostridia bacterium]